MSLEYLKHTLSRFAEFFEEEESKKLSITRMAFFLGVITVHAVWAIVCIKNWDLNYVSEFLFFDGALGGIRLGKEGLARVFRTPEPVNKTAS